jgi:putative two-component system response regulator
MSIDIHISRQTILIVDDEKSNLLLLNRILSPDYTILTAKSGQEALDRVFAADVGMNAANAATRPDLILLDIVMPDINGHEVCRQLQSSPAARDIPIIFLTASNSVEDEQRGLEMGAVDYIIKPVVPAIVRARVATHLQLKASADFLREKSAFLEDKSAFLNAEVIRRTSEIQEIQDVTILMMASMAETRDNETGNHILRTQHYVRLLARHLAAHPRFRDDLNEETIDLLYKSAPLHDIGKVGIPDHILLKPGRLTPEEFEVMKTHTLLGQASIARAEKRLGKEVGFLGCAKEIACSHHEKWNGSGYPHGLAGDDIPVSARLMALADVYDALISRRVYKPAMSHEQAKDIIVQGSGQHFDADVVQAFLSMENEFIAIAARFSDDRGQKTEDSQYE